VLRQYLKRHHQYQLYWTIALIMAFVATLSYVGMILVQPTSDAGILLFRFYYILGGALMPAWLGLGSIALVSSSRVSYICLTILYILSVLATVLIFFAQVDMTKLAIIAGSPGTGILQPGLWEVTIIILNSLGVVAVVGVAIYSGWKLMRRHAKIAGFDAHNLLWANVLILAGDLINGLAGGSARLGVKNIFWLVMTIGWIVFFAGVLLTNRRPVSMRTEASNSDTAEVKKQVASPS
jgi:hypothetical protein